MTRLGTKAKPAVVRVQTEERAQEIADLCDEHDWHVIVGVEPDNTEDITDVLKLLNPDRFTVRNQAPAVGRNDRCPCGSGRKYKHCCLRSGVTPSATLAKG
jgi:SWIM/SEC-C metal-binding protein